MRVVLLGPIGVGKGTQGIRLAAAHGAAHVATGDLLRQAVRDGTPIGLKAREYMDRGELVPDEVVVELLRERLSQPDATIGYVLDGFPRTLGQASALGEMLVEIDQHLDAAVSLEAPEDEVVARLASRASCALCGRPYTRPMDQDPGTCDVDGASLMRRDDDNPEAIRARLHAFRVQTQPVLAGYEEEGILIHIDGMGSPDEVTERIEKALSA